MDRRTFVGTLAAGIVAARDELAAQPPVSIDAGALRQRIEALIRVDAHRRRP